MKRLRMLTAALLVPLMILLFAGAAFSAASWQQKITRFSAIAGEALAVGNVVCIKGSDGKAYLADADDANLRPAVGVIGRGGSSGAAVEIVLDGIIVGMTEASPGARLFLSSATGGLMTTTAPTNAQPIGWVMPGRSGTATSGMYFIRAVMPASAGAAY